MFRLFGHKIMWRPGLKIFSSGPGKKIKDFVVRSWVRFVYGISIVVVDKVRFMSHEIIQNDIDL